LHTHHFVPHWASQNSTMKISPTSFEVTTPVTNNLTWNLLITVHNQIQGMGKTCSWLCIL
jgi:hypothetical protein